MTCTEHVFHVVYIIVLLVYCCHVYIMSCPTNSCYTQQGDIKSSILNFFQVHVDTFDYQQAAHTADNWRISRGEFYASVRVDIHGISWLRPHKCVFVAETNCHCCDE